MDAKTDNPDRTALGKRATGLTRRAYAQLLWEVYAPVLALGVLFVALFIIGASAGVWQRIGDPWRLLGLLTAIGFLIRAGMRARTKLKPTHSQAQRRVEIDSGLSHRPLDTLNDRAALGGDDVPAWRSHVSNAMTKIREATPSKLRPALAPIDKYYIRFLAPCALILAFMVGAGDNYERIRSSLIPGWHSGISADHARYEAWIDPPEYTGRPPSYFKDNQELSAPEGSEFVARVSGVKTAPRLIVREQGRTRRITPTRLGPKSFEARAILTKTATASYRIGDQSKEWILQVTMDQPPTVEFEDEPEAGKRDKLIFTYNLNDDFGVEKLSLMVALRDAPEQTEVIDVSLPGSSVQEAWLEPASLDLTKHKWAGKEVVGYLQAIDGKDQSAISEIAEFIIPDKIFVEPLAKAVAEQRVIMLAGDTEYTPVTPKKPKTIDALENQPMFAVDHPDETILRAPAEVQRTALLIEAVTDRPVGLFEDPTVYMGLRHIYGRLNRARDHKDLLGIPEDLWAIALRAEFGILGDALADMQAAERALNNAMARRAPQREIDALFERYNSAVDRYMEELTKKAIEEAKNRAGDESQGGGGGSGFNMDEIQALLDAIEEANRMGDTVAARRALAQLAQLLENMQIQLAQGGGGGGQGVGEGMSEELQEALEELNELLGEQRQLRDETQAAGREQADSEQQGDGTPQAGQGESGEGEGGSEQKSAQQLAEEQEQLQKLLEQLENGAGKDAIENAQRGANGTGGETGDETGEGSGSGTDIEQALRNARRAMEDSENALNNSEFYAAGRAQSDAIDALRELGEGLFAEEARRLQQDADANGGQDGGDGDPFGRENNNNGVGDVEIPEIDDRQRARDLLEKLRKRSGEQGRDKDERDYLERLLERF